MGGRRFEAGSPRPRPQPTLRNRLPSTIPPLAATNTRAVRMSTARPSVPRTVSIESKGQNTQVPEVGDVGVMTNGLADALDHRGPSSAARRANQYRVPALNPETVTCS